jgi:hypothetical protein
MREDNTLTPEQLARFAKKGSHCPAWVIRSMAQELQRRREWDAPVAADITPDRAVLDRIRALLDIEEHP